MTRDSNVARFACAAIAAIATCATLSETDARAQSPAAAPDEGILGTIVVDGSAGNSLPPLPKLALLPLLTQNQSDSIVQLVTRRDLELSGQFELAEIAAMPPGPHVRDGSIDWLDWRKKGIEYVVRVYATAQAGASIELTAEAFISPKKEELDQLEKDRKENPDKPLPKVDVAYSKKLVTTQENARKTSHKLVDALLGGLTGRPGGFSSHMVYAGVVGKWRQVFTLDSDGFNMKPIGPSDQTVISPTFGPGGEVVYAMSENYRRFRLYHGAFASPVPMSLTGSLLGLAFAPDKKRMAIATMEDGVGTIFLSSPNGQALTPVSKEPLANYPAFGPLGKLAYIAGLGNQRVYVDGKPLSPPGFLASAPCFCDAPEGLMVLLTVGVSSGSDVIGIDTAGGRIRRLTQNMGNNKYAACSPDGRLVAFFSNTKGGRGPGLYLAPISRPYLAKKIANEVGEGLRWEPLNDEP